MAKYIREQEVAAKTGRALSTLRNDRHRGRGIPYYKLGKSVRYLESEVYEFMEKCKIETKDFR